MRIVPARLSAGAPQQIADMEMGISGLSPSSR